MTPIVFAIALGPLVFSSPWMALWGLAAAAPIIIHLLSRRKYRQIPWAAMTYLLEAMRKNSRRIQIEQLILLLVRALVVLLIALAITDLSCRRSPLGGALGTDLRTLTVLVIDGSYSMAHKEADSTRFQRAKRLAMELIDSGARGDGYTLILLADPPRVIVPEPAFDPADVKEEIKSLRLPHAGGDLPATLAEVEKILRTAREKHPRLAQRRVCFFTDLQRTTWGAGATDQGKDCLARLAQLANLALVDLSGPQDDNLAITHLECAEPYVTVSRDVTFHAQVKNFGREDVGQRAVELLIDGQRAGGQRVDVPAGKEVTVSLAHRFETPGEHRLEIRLGPDRLDVDNHRWLVVPVRESVRVLCVRGKQGAAFFLTRALEPNRNDRPEIRSEVVSENALWERDLGRYDCIFLCNVGRFSRDEAGVLKNYVADGGGLVFFLGDQVRPEGYNQPLGAGGVGGQGILPAVIGETAELGEYRFDARDYGHPIVRPWKGVRAYLTSTPVARYFRLSPDAKSGAAVALWFDTGDPAIVERTVGRGRSVVVATAASIASVDRSSQGPTVWSGLGPSPAFPPLAHQLLAFAARGRFEGRGLTVGDELTSSIHNTAATVPLEIKPPDRPPERVRLKIEGEESSFRYDGADTSGIYAARFGPPVSTEQFFAVNVDTRESDLARIDPDVLPESLSRGLKTAEPDEPSLVIASAGHGLFRYLLAVVLVLLVVETMLAWRFGTAA